MFALLGAGEVLALLVIGGFVAPMFMTPSHRGGPLLYARRVEVHYDRWPAVLIMAAHGGFAPWLLRLINKAPWTCLEAAPEYLTVHIGGVFRDETGPIPYSNIISVDVKHRHPKYHIAAMIVVGGPMLVYAIARGISLLALGKGVTLVALISMLAAVQSTNNLVFDIEGRKGFFGRKKPLVLPFSTISLNRKYPAATHADLSVVADRITQLSREARLREGRLDNSQVSRLEAQDVVQAASSGRAAVR